jgi:hypothetical protein
MAPQYSCAISAINQHLAAIWQKKASEITGFSDGRVATQCAHDVIRGKA